MVSIEDMSIGHLKKSEYYISLVKVCFYVIYYNLTIYLRVHFVEEAIFVVLA